MAKLKQDQLFSDKKIYGGMNVPDTSFDDINILGSNAELETVLTDKKGESKATRQGKMIAVHFDSDSKVAFPQLEYVLAQAKDGDIIGGDFNINFADINNWNAFKTALKDAGYRIEMSADAIDKLQLTFKKRSEGLEINQQPFKAGIADVFVKDLAFKLVKCDEEDRECVDTELDEKILELIESRDSFIDEYNELRDKDESGSVVNGLCEKYKVINYHNLEQSYGDDHPSTHYVDEDSKTIYYFKNSVKHQDYNFTSHFKKGVTEQDYKLAYKALTDKVFHEFSEKIQKNIFHELDENRVDKTDYFVLNGILLNPKMRFSERYRKDFSDKFQEALCEKNGDGKYVLTGDGQEVLRELVRTIYGSDEFEEVNNLLANPFTEDEITDIVENLPKDQSVASRPDKLINAIFQHGQTSIPEKSEKTLSLNGTGFAPFKDEDGNIINSDQVHQKQIKNELDEIKGLVNKHGAKVVVAQIEAKGQDNKSKRILESFGELEIDADSESSSNEKRLNKIKLNIYKFAQEADKPLLNALSLQFERILKDEFVDRHSNKNNAAKERKNKLDAIYAIFEKVRDRQLISPEDLAILKENTGLGKNIGLNAESYNALYQHAKDYQVKTAFSLLAKDKTNGFNFNDIDESKCNYNDYQKDALKTIKSICTEVIEKHFDDKIIAKDLNKDQKDGLSFSFSGEGSIEKPQENPQEISLCKLANKIANKEKVEANDYEVLSQKQQDQLKKPIDKFNTYSVNLKADLITKLESQKNRILGEINYRRENPNNSHLDIRLGGLERMKNDLGYNPDNGSFNGNFMYELVNNKEKELKSYGLHVHRANGFFSFRYGATTSFQNLIQAVEKIESRYNKSDDRLKISAVKEINKAIESEIYRLEPGYKKIAEINKIISELENERSISAEDKSRLYENRTSILGELTSTTKKETDHLIQAYNEALGRDITVEM